jgi:7-cyano-7-deazaguanine synthase
MPETAVIVASGGLDSTTLAYFLKSQGYRLAFLSFDYGQRHKKELGFASQTAKRLDASFTLLDLHAAGITAILGDSALTNSAVSVPHGHYAWENMRVTVVPNRNAIMLTLAYALAISTRASVVATAVHAGDHAIYPDCRPEFISAFEQMESLACAGLGDVTIQTPFLQQTKANIVATGSQLGVPFAETWSCYEGGELHCGACGTCFERREAFDMAGVADPTEYVTAPQYQAAQ